MHGKDGKQCVAVRYVNDQGQQQIVSEVLICSNGLQYFLLQDMKCGSVEAHRWFKRVE